MNASTQEILAEPDTHWLSLRLQENDAAVWNVENVTVYVQRVVGDLMVARAESDESKAEQTAQLVSSVPLNLDWKRWSLEKHAEEVRFWPAFPDKSLVVKTRIPIIIPPKTSVELYINLPIWLEISVGQRGEHWALDKIAPSRLSNTWYGTLFEGELCYALKSRARRALEDLALEPLRAACRFKINNRSAESLPVEKIRVIPAYLNLYQTQERLWTSSVEVNFRDHDEGSEISYAPTAPDFLVDPQLLRQAEKTFQRHTLLDKLIFKPLGLND